jgi:hypothetical protein
MGKAAWDGLTHGLPTSDSDELGMDGRRSHGSEFASGRPKLDHVPAGVSGACKVFRIGLRVKNAGIINGGETHQLEAIKSRRYGPRVDHSLGVEFQAFESDGDREIESSVRP